MKISLVTVSLLLTKLQTVFAVANLAGVQVPSAIPDAITKLQGIANTAQGFVLPDSAANDIADVEKILTTAELVIPHQAAQAHLQDVLSLIEQVPATLTNLENGQPAELFNFEMSFKDGADKVDVFALRRKSTSSVAQDLGTASEE